MSTPWVRRHFKQSRLRDAWRMSLFAISGLALGAGVFFLIERFGG